ncbi:MAG: 30S ribosomal protein S11 [Candidatus Parcubacteria bacterium]|nr:30S ribosomal protein S11 [Candidatus Parcubacteria bacterium]
MGKTRIASKTEEEIIKEADTVDETIKKVESKVSSKKRVEKGCIYISASYNNTIMTATDMYGKVLAWTSAGSLGFKGPKKATPFAASKVAEALIEKIEKNGLKEVEVYVKGVGGGRESSIRSLSTHGLDIKVIKDVTPVPHNGPKPPKVRRV